MRTPKSFQEEFSNSHEYRKLFCAKSLAAMARTVLFIIRLRKVSASAFFHLCTFLDGPDPYPTLDQMRAELRLHFKVKMSKSGLLERFSPGAVAFMQAAFQGVAKIEFRPRYACKRLSIFSEILVADSTVLNLDPKCACMFRGSGGGASASSAKVQFCFGLLSGTVRELSLHHGVRADSSHRFSGIVPNALYLADMAYSTVENLNAIMDGGGWFVARYRYGTTLTRTDGRPVTQRALDRWVRMLKPGDTVDMPVFMTKERVALRLVLRKLPQEVGDGIRRKLKADKQKKCKNMSAERLAFCDVNAFITSMDGEMMPAKLLREVYALRWQVEIMFKSWKSGLDIDEVRNVGPRQFQCMLYGRLIRVLISMRILWKAKQVYWGARSMEISELKGMSQLAGMLSDIRDWLVTKKRKNASIIREIWIMLTQTCIKDRKKDDLTPFETIQFYA